MKERLVRGTNVRDVVKTLRVHQRGHTLPPLGQWEQDLLRKRVSNSTWYSLKVFDSLLQVVHRYVYDGSETAAQTMGRAFAKVMEESGELDLTGVTPQEALKRMPSRWRSHFNFGEISVDSLPPEDGVNVVRIRLNGYPDMSASHGHSIVGWSMELAERAGAKDLERYIEERPWMHNSVLTYTLRFR